MFRPPTIAATPATPLVPTDTSVNALRALALYVSLRLPVLLTSTPSSGKTLLLSHLASTLYPDVRNQLVTINLADTSVDGRSLLGSYVQSTRSPGTFEWKEGVLVRTMRTGRWVILQDVDKGSNEVLGTLNALVESLGMGKWIGGRAKLAVPSRGEVVASESFAIFATRSHPISGDDTFPSPTFFGAHKFHEVVIPTPTQEELRTIIAASFPRLSGSTAGGIVMLWSAIRAVGSTTTDRVIGLRDLRKYCTRFEALLPGSYRPLVADTSGTQVDYFGVLVSVFPNPTLREAMFLEARDVFFGAGSLTTASRTRTTAIAAIAAEHLGLTQEKCDWLLGQHVPEVVTEIDSNGRTTGLRLGRIGLSVQTTKSEITVPPIRPFVIHRPAATLMSRIATCVSMGEPVLLTGETGTGKTSVITHLASLLRHPLISVNLSQQTESSDLLGSYKPIDARVPGSELQLRFLDLFRSTFSQKKNVKFEESTWQAIKEGKWKRAGGLWKESVRLAKDRIRSKLSGATRCVGGPQFDRMAKTYLSQGRQPRSF
jgi:midasin